MPLQNIFCAPSAAAPTRVRSATCKLFSQIIWYAKHFRQILILEICTQQKKKKGGNQEEYNKTAKSTRQCSREQRQQQQRQRAALGVDGRPRGAEIRSILFGARNHHKSHADVIKAAFCTALVCMATSPAMSLLRRARHVMCATCRRRAGILCFPLSSSLSLSFLLAVQRFKLALKMPRQLYPFLCSAFYGCCSPFWTRI